MPNPFFYFKQFAIRQDKSVMKVGTDSVLLGAWVDICLSPPCKVLDVGTGTGIIALMIAQRNSRAIIDAIDIDVDACNLSFENAGKSPFKERIQVFRQSFFDYTAEKKYGLIVSNPPFFKNSLKSPNEKRSVARHNDSLPLKPLVEHAISLLSENGRIALILPVSLSDELDFIVATHRLFVLRRTDVVTVEGGLAKRFLVEITANNPQKQDQNFKIIKDTLILETTDHQWTEQYKTLTRDFYL